jgi:hypothetical protein
MKLLPSPATYLAVPTWRRLFISIGLALVLLSSPMANAIEFILDDGAADASVGVQTDADLIALNSFPVAGPSVTINSISVAFGSVSNGTPFQGILWSDPDGDGVPTDALMLTTASGLVANAGTDTFVKLNIAPTLVTTDYFFVGFMLTELGDAVPGALDLTPPNFPDRSFVTAAAPGTGNIFDLTANGTVPLTSLDDAQVEGNWLIRASGSFAAVVPETASSIALFSLGLFCLLAARVGCRAVKVRGQQ